MLFTSRPAGLTAFLICLVAAVTFILASSGAAQAGLTVSARNLLADDGGDSNEKPGGTVLIVGTRNGAFSGKVAVRGGRITRAAVSDLKGRGGTISARQIRLRYAVPWGKDMRGQKPRRRDILLEAPPAGGTGDVDLWIIVAVPKWAGAGTYRGKVAIQASGGRATVPVELKVADWTLPDTQNYRTWVELVQSPDTLALEYGVPLWSDKHWELIARSLELISPTGSRVIYIPLIARTNYGNDESMVRWVKKGKNRYEPDFSVMEKYLDLVEQHLGAPKITQLYAWEVYLAQSKRGAPVEVKGREGSYEWRESSFAKALHELKGTGPAVTVYDPATKKTGQTRLPRYENPAARGLWKPAWDGVRARLAKRGWEKSMMIGNLGDIRPTKEEVAALSQLSGNAPWTSCSHHARWVFSGKAEWFGAPVGHTAVALDWKYNLNPAKGRHYGWKQPLLHGHYWRFGWFNTNSPIAIRHEAECLITGNKRGVSHLGADFWPCIKGKSGRRFGTVTDRYPESYWHSLNIGAYMLAPGPDGPVGTVRLELFREGIQECEARIFIESALTGQALKRRLGAALAKRAQDCLDQRLVSIWKGRGVVESDLQQYGLVEKYREWYGVIEKRMNGKAGWEWYLGSGWEERTGQLFAVAGEVARALGLQVVSRPKPASRAKPAKERPKEPPPATARAPVERSPEQVCRGWFSLAANYKRVGMKEKARQYLQKVIDTYPDTEHAEKARQMMKGL